MTEGITTKADYVLALAQRVSVRVAVAESCTGGLLAAALTDIPGSSAVFERGFVTYSNQAKHESLGVPVALIEEHGAVSEPVAVAMAEGALKHSYADIAVSITGIAGPGGGSAEKPIGLVYIGLARTGHRTQCQRHIFTGNRQAIRKLAVTQSLDWLIEELAE